MTYFNKSYNNNYTIKFIYYLENIKNIYRLIFIIITSLDFVIIEGLNSSYLFLYNLKV